MSCRRGRFRKNPLLSQRIFAYSDMLKSPNMRLPWLFAALVLSAILALFQWWAVTEFLYWRYPWSDIPMHYLGGVTLSVCLTAVLLHRRDYVYVSLLAAVFVGWEIFELIFGIPREANYPLDTILDLVMDTLGALTVYLVARKTLWRSK